jgi:hypothetical protein
MHCSYACAADIVACEFATNQQSVGLCAKGDRRQLGDGRRGSNRVDKLGVNKVSGMDCRGPDRRQDVQVGVEGVGVSGFML